MRGFVFIFVFLPFVISAQNQPGTSLHIKKAKAKIILDGKLEEEDWKTAQVAKDWFLNFPVDDSSAPYQTEARVTFDDQYFYASFVCMDDNTPDLINSLRRDFDYPLNDNVGVNIGPYNDGLNGFFFAVTPAGVQREGIISGGGAGGDAFNSFWDNKWFSVVERYDDRWIAEFAIPWKSFRYKDGLKEWNILFDRSDKKRNLRSSWIRTPIQFQTGMFAFSGKLIWDDPIPPAHTNISFIPYIAGNTSKDSESTPEQTSSDLQAGFDAKVGITPSLNLDLTLNPDFSQVEVDQQVINLTRFEFRFPERRQFFLENSDLFNRAGLPEARPFFSRRVGLIQDSSGLYQKVPIVFGARLSGSLDENWRLSVMNMQTKKELKLGLPAQNYTVATVQRNFWRQSSFAVTFVNKESLHVGDGDSTLYFHESIFKPIQVDGDTVLQKNAFNRVIAFDLEMLSPDNKWHSSSFASRSYDNFSDSENIAAGTFLEYSTRPLYIRFKPTYIGKNYNAEAGFVPSAGVYPGQLNIHGGATYRFFRNYKALVWMGPSFLGNQTYIPGGTLTDRDYLFTYTWNFLNTAILELSYNYIFQKLTNDFSPVGSEYTPFLAGEEYNWQTASASFISNSRSIFNFLVKTTYGGFYNGTNFNVNGQLNVRYQPYGNVSLQFDYNDVKLPDEYGNEKIFLIGPRIDLTLTDKVFLTTYFQYNSLLDNVNLNARFQWRYKPASDIFIVYTENYFPNHFTSKNKALVFKVTYWLNL
ncbi:MAG TPA: DUF5916 domain-containing protein [Cyclobacteriaceae bacterium]|nr:DUF5916 domain-containing protein [Cyclobacteriaceae bacterium]